MAIARVEDFDHAHVDPHHLRVSREKAAQALSGGDLPARYSQAVTDDLRVQQWATEIVRAAVATGHPVPTVQPGDSILLSGTTGTGKTWQAYGVVRALAASGVRCRWSLGTAAAFLASLRPRHGVDSEAEFRRWADAPYCLLDDLGAEKPSEWTIEQVYRLIDHRYTHMLPTIVTTNLGANPAEKNAPTLRSVFGDRVASRLNEMADRIVLTGPDRRTHSRRNGDAR